MYRRRVQQGPKPPDPYMRMHVCVYVCSDAVHAPQTPGKGNSSMVHYNWCPRMRGVVVVVDVAALGAMMPCSASGVDDTAPAGRSPPRAVILNPGSQWRGAVRRATRASRRTVPRAPPVHQFTTPALHRTNARQAVMPESPPSFPHRPRDVCSVLIASGPPPLEWR
ncbi:hypothetical protein BC834DRAFT_885610 [Gloeopeniophorella convolvens]|nr:hypothetical protein BC834DRAFT_885610 [Gloeopeniophorella convolvens]